MAKAIAPAVRFFHRFGFAAKGLVYVLVGALALKAVIARRGAVQDEQGALHQVLAAPFGKVFLLIAAAGLLMYVVWRLVELWSDPERKGSFARSQALLSALVYSTLAIEAVRMVLGMRTGGGGDSEAKEQAAFLISLPFGHWLTVVVATAPSAWGSRNCIARLRGTLRIVRRLRASVTLLKDGCSASVGSASCREGSSAR